jgi:membrane protein
MAIPETDTTPGGPTDLNVRSWKGVATRTFREFREDNLTDWAAALTYYGVLAIFPALLALFRFWGWSARRPPSR